MEHPQILTLNLNHDIVQELQSKGFNVYDGSIGKLIDLNLKYNASAKCLLQSDYPDNFHEYDVLILDLTNVETVTYIPSEHKRSLNKSGNESYLVCEYPQTTFDPRAITLHLLKNKIQERLSDNFLLVIFGSEDEEIEYCISDNGYTDSHTYNIYDFLEGYIPAPANKHGLQTKVLEIDKDIYRLLRKYNSEMSYNIVFTHPKKIVNHIPVDDPRFFPLMLNKTDEIVSFGFLPTGKSGIFAFPQLNRKAEFLTEFLSEVAPSTFPSLFPNNSKNSWVNDEDYALPNQQRLIEERLALDEDYRAKLAEKNKEIEENKESYSFLHDLLTKTDAELVNAVIGYLQWLGFENVKDGDEVNAGGIKEEDIQIETERGLLIFEVKGISSTSKDSDCSQIGKIKFRRAKQRNKFDVYANYIVNHQRYLPPLNRKDPPFTTHQIQDALNDERGLITTWQLFRLYFDIENGLFSKTEIRNAFFNFGLIDFISNSHVNLGSPTEFFKEGKVVIISLPIDKEITVGDSLIIKEKNGYKNILVKTIQVEGKEVNTAKGIEVGLLLSEKISKKSTLYKVIK